MRKGWETIKARIKDGTNKVEWHNDILKAMETSVANISWDSFKQRLGLDTVWTLVHGDYHPANQLIDPNQEDG